ncbi:MAG: FHA domain-containing protein [Candidatus Nealsonbacteria bacterium]|nr:FHA domain-containing protein [Candidatus Nealsonbacteria bacterium]
MEVKLVLIGGKAAGREVPVAGPEFLIGRSEECHLRPQSSRVSRRHTMIVVQEGYVGVRDLGSSNGTYVNDEKIDDEKELKNGDQLKVGPLEFEVQLAVQVGGKKRPKVHNVQEAAARTVEAAGNEDLDITSWLEDGDDDDADVPAVMTIDQLRKKRAEEAKKAEEENADNEEEGTAPKTVGQFGDKKPTTESSRDAASDMLKQFYGKQ